MEVTNSLSLVQRRLKNKINMNLKKNWSDDAEDEWSAKLEITEALRNDAMQKCSRKLDSVLPVTKLQNLSLKQIDAENRKIKPNPEKFSNDSVNRKSTQHHSESNYDVKEEDIGSPLPDPTWNEDGRSDYLDEETYPDSSTVEAGTLGLEYGKLEGIETSEASKQISFDIDRREEEAENTEDLNKSMGKSSLKADELNKLTIPPPFKVAGGDVKPQSIIDPQTGKRKCLICAKKYGHQASMWKHHKSAHAKVKYKCKLCKKDFPRKENYEVHYLGIHMGVKFKCGKCNKTFTANGNLKTHQKKCTSKTLN